MTCPLSRSFDEKKNPAIIYFGIPVTITVTGIRYSSQVAVSKPRDQADAKPDTKPDKCPVRPAGPKVTDDGAEAPHNNRVRIQAHFLLLCPLRTL
jgi:hypothetical protein